MTRPDPVALLGFTARWLELGVVDRDRIEALGREFEVGDDPNPEHYRWRAFSDFLAGRRPLPPALAEALYSLGEEDADRGAGLAMMAAVANLPECPAAVQDRAMASGDRGLSASVLRTRLRTELEGELTDESFERCLASADGAVQRTLVDRTDLTPQHLERIAAEGANRAVRNLAAARLRRRR
jgi:hypothetical protein